MSKLLTQWGDIFVFAGEGPEAAVQCARCGAHICRAADNWKEHAIARSASFTDLGSHAEDHPDLVAWEYFCPACARRLWVEFRKRGQAPDRDFAFRF